MIPANADHHLDLAADYALGLLEGGELEEFERHLASGCAECERELAVMDAVGDALAYSTAVLPAPPHLREHVLEAVAADLAIERGEAPSMVAEAPHPVAGQALYPGQPTLEATYAPSPAAWPPRRDAPPPPPIPRWMRAAPALALVALAAAVAAGVQLYRLQGKFALVRADLERVQAERHALERVADVAKAEHVRLVALGGAAAAPGSHGRVLWSPETKEAVLYAYGLPRPSAGRDYQVWVIDGGAWRSAGVLAVDAQGGAVHVLPELPAPAGVSGFAVTLEPAGGGTQPTGPAVLGGDVATGGG